MCSLACKMKKIKEKPTLSERIKEKAVSTPRELLHRIMSLTDENKEKNAENLKKARKNDEKTEPW